MTAPEPRTIIIDGYNVLRRAFRFLEEDHGLEAARAKLEVRLREFLRAAGPGVRVVLVYDGVEGAGESTGTPGAPLEVIFSRPPRSADDAVIEECRRQPPGGSITVVSSDLKDIARRVQGAGVRHLTSEEFGDLLDAALEKPRRAGRGGGARRDLLEPEKPSEIPPEEAERWLEIFSQPKRPRGKKE